MKLEDIIDILCDDIIINILCYKPFINLDNFKISMHDNYAYLSHQKKNIIIKIPDAKKILFDPKKHDKILPNIDYIDSNIKVIQWIYLFFKHNLHDVNNRCCVINILNGYVITFDNILVFKCLYNSIKKDYNNLNHDFFYSCLTWNSEKIIRYIIENTYINVNKDYSDYFDSRPCNKPIGFDWKRKKIIEYLKSKNKISKLNFDYWDYFMMYINKYW